MAGADAATRQAGKGPQTPESFWRSLHFFSIYRLIVAAVFYFAATFLGAEPNLGSLDPRLFTWVGGIYLLAAIGFLWLVNAVRRFFNLQLTAQVVTDVLALTLLMYASGGTRSGIGVMIFVVLAGAGLVGQGRMTMFYAALATLAVLFEQAYRFVRLDEDVGGFFRTGLTSIGFFGTAIVARLLARRVVANEALARQRGQELANQLRINERVIRDMQDGVLVVDTDGRIRQHNPQAAALLGRKNVNGTLLSSVSVPLAERFAQWSRRPMETETLIHGEGSHNLRVRLLPPGEGGSALIYLEDMGRIQAQAQQLKLAALGRLTANMAHEIRNPLSAVSHAAELLVDEEDWEAQARLIRIIRDNTQRLNRLVEEVLELGRRDRAQPEPLRLASYLAQFMDEFAINDPHLRGRVKIEAEADAVILFDRAHFHRVAWNLLANALRHCSDADGAVVISARLGPKDNVLVDIVDDGPGIGESLRSQVFEPFFTTHGSGTGLGLYIARELCEANGARLELLANAPGAHFRITAKGI